nr:ERCC4 domain-containing protein [Promineifilum sp.]
MAQDTIQSVLIDHREPPHVQRLAFDGATVAVTQLACGDIWVAAADGNLLVIERKTADDLLTSIADGRLFDQAAAMTAMPPWSYTAGEGTLAPAASGKTLADGAPVNWRWASVQGALQTVQELGVAVVYLFGPEELAPFIDRLARRD